MKYSAIGLIFTVGAFRSCLGAETKECRTDVTVTGDIATTLDLHNPEQLNAFEGCTVLKGHIVIQADYEGEFSLNEITSFQGNVSTIEDGVEGLGLFELEKLREIDHLHLLGLSGDVKLPKLEGTGNIELVQLSDKGSVDLSSLIEADDVSIRGSWLDTKIGSLKTVNLGTQFCASQNCSIYGPERQFPYIDVDLPSLEKTDYFEVAGAVKSVSVPKLEVVGYVVWPPSDYFPMQGLRINIEETKDNSLDFDAPKLHTINGSIEAYGGLSSLSLGSLGKTSVRITLNTDNPLSFYSTLQTAEQFNIWGKLRSIYLPEMKDLGYVGLSYSPKLPCNDTLYLLWQTQEDNSSDWDDYNSCLDYDYPQYKSATSEGTATMTTATSPTTQSTGQLVSSNEASPSKTYTQAVGTKTASGSTESSTPENKAGMMFSIPLLNCFALLMMTTILMFFF